MPNIFGEDIAGLLNTELGPLLFNVTLRRLILGKRRSTNLTEKKQSTQDVVGRGFVSDYKAYLIDGTIIQRGDRMVTILGASLPSGVIPRANNKTIIENETKTIIHVDRDPAGATYKCQVR